MTTATMPRAGSPSTPVPRVQKWPRRRSFPADVVTLPTHIVPVTAQVDPVRLAEAWLS